MHAVDSADVAYCSCIKRTNIEGARKTAKVG